MNDSRGIRLALVLLLLAGAAVRLWGIGFGLPLTRAQPDESLRQTFRAVDMQAPQVYDQQDAFFLPLAGLSGIGRPDPNISVFRRR